jgi:squalene cyclase
VLGVYSWDGINSIAPELWMLPYWVPFHPGRWWCHCRVVYLPMGYLFGRRAVAKETPLVRQLRQELYCEPYDSIDWVSCRDLISPLDKYIDRHWITYPLFGTSIPIAHLYMTSLTYYMWCSHSECV